MSVRTARPAHVEWIMPRLIERRVIRVLTVDTTIGYMTGRIVDFDDVAIVLAVGEKAETILVMFAAIVAIADAPEAA